MVLLVALNAGCGGGGGNTEVSDTTVLSNTTGNRADLPTPTGSIPGWQPAPPPPIYPGAPMGTPITELPPLPEHKGNIPQSQRFVVVNGHEYVGEQISVEFKQATSRTDSEQFSAKMGLGWLYRSSVAQFHVLSVPEGVNLVDLTVALKMQPEVKNAEFVGLVYGTGTIGNGGLTSP